MSEFKTSQYQIMIDEFERFWCRIIKSTLLKSQVLPSGTIFS